MEGPTTTALAGVAGLSLAAWVALALGALLVGFAKTAISGVAAISVALFAAALPARQSTGALLPLLILGDLLALHAYRAHAAWPTLLRLFPSVGLGVGVGVLFVSRVDDVTMRRTIGVILLLLLAVALWQRRRPGRADAAVAHHGAAVAFGSMAGFTTMVANAGGAVMALYLLAARLDKLVFLGTTAWFFFLVNLVKVPFSIGLGLLTADSLQLNAVLAPAVVLGAVIGRLVIHRIEQGVFETLVLIFTAVSALNLVR